MIQKPKLVKEMTKKQQKEHHSKKRGLPVPPPQIHKSVKDYDRSDNQKVIDDDSLEMWEDEDEEEQQS